VTVAVTVADCPESKAVSERTGALTERAGLTVSAVVDDEAVRGVAAPSVRLAQ
jgi:hypothetical protein